MSNLSGAAAQLQLGATYSSTFVEKNNLQGTTITVVNMNPSDKSVPQIAGNIQTTYRLVKNASGGALASKLCCDWTSGSWGTSVAGLAGTSDHVAGVVDQYLGTATVPNGDYFFVAQKGPHLVTSSASYSAMATLAPAASGKTAGSSTPPNDFDFGYAIQAASAGDEEKLAFLDCQGAG